MMRAAAVFAGAVLMTTPALAQPGQCTVTGVGTFGCDVTVDGGGLSFALPDGDILAFTLEQPELGMAYLIGKDARPGASPRELGSFEPAENPGCWIRKDCLEFCVLVVEGEDR